MAGVRTAYSDTSLSALVSLTSENGVPVLGFGDAADRDERSGTPVHDGQPEATGGIHDVSASSTGRWGPRTSTTLSELPHPARADALAEGGASCFRDALFYGRSAWADRPHRERSLRRREFGVTHSYSVAMARAVPTVLFVGL